MTKLATIYKMETRYVIHSNERTTDGVYLACEPSFKLKLDAEDAELGTAIWNALDATKTEVPHPTEWKGHTPRFLKLVGAKSVSSLYRTSKSLSAYEEEGRIKLTPWVKDPHHKGLVPETSREQTVLRKDPVELAAAVREMFDNEPAEA